MKGVDAKPSNPCLLTRMWNNPKGKTAIITFIVLAAIALAVTLGLHYGVGFEKVHDWFKGLNAGEWIGVGTGGATVLLSVGGGYLVYRGCTRKPKEEALL